MDRIFIRKLMKQALIVSVIGLFAAQFIPVDRSNPQVESDISASPEVKMILRKACYDCHSHETVWPWYSKIAPFSFLIAYDVHEGREVLNFSTWAKYDTKHQTKKLKEIWEEIEEGEMPPWTYTLMHSEAALSASEKELIRTWVNEQIAK